MSTQKLVTTRAVNALGEIVETHICSTSTEAAADIYNKLGYRLPFRKNENLYYPNLNTQSDEVMMTDKLELSRGEVGLTSIHALRFTLQKYNFFLK